MPYNWSELGEGDRRKLLQIIAEQSTNERCETKQFPEYESVWQWGSDFLLQFCDVAASAEEIEFTFRLIEWVNKEVM